MPKNFLVVEALNAKVTSMQADEIAFKEKRKNYEPHLVNLPSGDVFLPFVMETFGSIQIVFFVNQQQGKRRKIKKRPRR
jgi:hypothetical protein